MFSRRSFFAATVGVIVGASGFAFGMDVVPTKVDFGLQAVDLPSNTDVRLAADLPVLPPIGEAPLRKNRPHEEKRERALRTECNRPIPAKETDAQYLRRMSLPCPGRLE